MFGKFSLSDDMIAYLTPIAYPEQSILLSSTPSEWQYVSCCILPEDHGDFLETISLLTDIKGLTSTAADRLATVWAVQSGARLVREQMWSPTKALLYSFSHRERWCGANP